MNLKRTLLPLAAGLCLAASAAPASATPMWHDGVSRDSIITNCSSIIQGNPYQEIGAKSYAGMWLDTDAPPKVGETFYVHVVMATLGGHCNGPYGRPEISLPSGVTPAITAEDRVRCWGINFENNTAKEDTAWCPSQPQQAYYGGQYAFGPTVNDPVAWPMPRGKGWEIWIPVKSNRQLKGMASNPVDQVQGSVKLFDGNSSPVLNPTALLLTDAVAGGGGGGNNGGGGGGQPDPGPVTPGNPDPGAGNPGPGTTDPGTTNPGQEPLEQPAMPAPAANLPTRPSATAALTSLLRSASVAKSAKRSAVVAGGLPVSVTLGGTAAEVKAVLSVGGKTVAGATRRNARGTVKLTLKPSKRSARLLRRGKKAKVAITVTPKKGASSKTIRTVTIG